MGYEASFIGLLLSFLFIELTGYYPGGIIVPSYLALFIDQPLRLAATLAVAVLTHVSYVVLSRYIILFGRRRLIIMLMIGGCWTMLLGIVLPSFVPVLLEYQIIGWLIPGLIANHFERQGILVTLSSLATVTVMIYFLSLLLGYIF